MKKLLALALVAVILISGPVAFAIQFPRQVDPLTAPTDPVYGQGLYLLYGSIATAISGGNFTGAAALLRETPFVHIPPEILDVYDTFNDLMNSTANQFVVIRAQLNNASAYIASGRLVLARDNLTAALSNLRSVNQTLTQLFDAEPQLAALTGIPSSLFLPKLQPMESLYNSYSAEANRLLTVLTGLTKLDQTSVTLSVAQSTIQVGSNVSVAGTLAGPAGDPLPSRIVTVYFQSSAIGTATTNSSGGFSAEFRTPYYYKQNATMFASFLPAGSDSLVYSPSTSAPVFVTVTFATPSVSIHSPSSVFAGQPMSVNGTLSLGGASLSGYTVTLSGFRTSALAANEVASTRTSPDGRFSLALTPSSSLSAGTYLLTLTTSGNGTVGPLSVPIHVDLIKESTTVAANAPAFALAGFPVTITGSATVNGTALSGAKVVDTSPAPAVNTVTSSSGSFNFTVTPSLTTPTGGWAHTVGVDPSQTWISSGKANVSVFVINPLVLLFPVSSLGMLLLVVRRRRVPGQPQTLTLLEEPRAPEPSPAPRTLTGIPAIYHAAVELAEKATGVTLRPQMTIREYLRTVQSGLRGFEHFRFISMVLEAHLYAGGAASGDEAKAKAELDALRGELES